ncbi:tail fiber domain-containing protein [bacterium]|nr:tail fiber domain-containing protein [bacterium]
MKKSTYLLGLALGASTLTFAQVGIGTSTPSSPLDIQADDAAIDLNSEAADGSRDPKINFQLTGTTTFSIGLDDADSDKLKIGVGAPETSTRMTIDGSGNVGIGNTSPTAKLDVDGSAIFNESGAAVDFRVEGDTEANLLFVDASADAVGVGTNSPRGHLELAGALFLDNQTVTFGSGGGIPGGSTTESASIVFSSDGTTTRSLALSTDSDGNLSGTVGAGATRQVTWTLGGSDGTISENYFQGSIGVGRTSPRGKIDAEGGIIIENQSMTFASGGGAGTVTESAAIVFDVGRTLAVAADANGSLTGTTGGGGGRNARWHIDGNAGDSYVTGNFRSNADNVYDLGTSSIRWNDVYATNGTIQTSDRRLKTNIESLKYGLAEVMQLTPVSFNWKNDSAQTRNKIGYIAQDVQKLIPEVVNVGDNEEQTLGMNYGEMVVVLTNAIKEQQAIIEAHKKENESQKSELKTQKAEIESLKAEASNATSSSEENASEIEALKAQVQQLLQLIQQQESASVVK